MNDTALATIAATGFAVAFLHAAIPTHWLPFVLVGRARGWTTLRTLTMVAGAGLGHVALTSLLGLAIAWFGFRLDESLGHAFPLVTSGLLFAIAIYYGYRQWTGRGVCHHHPPGSEHAPSKACDSHEHDHGHTHWEEELKGTPLVKPDRGDWAAVSGLFVMLTLSPCEGFLPIYLSGVQFGWRGFVVLSLILALGAVGGMTLLTWLTLKGSERLRIERFEHYEAGLLAVLFVVLGVIAFVLQHEH
ncbi:hypothetical protein [Synoicihabitans lomoniglobus]|uniref:Urease accessory protein UreH-like transmembrane domain-containing protein n=1 Tax=Synoicihabitans lomoniglobus TaxID=2909285 RepID=A0AAF0I3P2_9BACT|nr:hypothetical protein [Opitutaceae bacterium LMO-M01]WED66269.1 hypothetical protein PXH66_05335 [Opitutaceae bacterium LMO-M01]